MSTGTLPPMAPSSVASHMSHASQGSAHRVVQHNKHHPSFTHLGYLIDTLLRGVVCLRFKLYDDSGSIDYKNVFHVAPLVYPLGIQPIIDATNDFLTKDEEASQKLVDYCVTQHVYTRFAGLQGRTTSVTEADEIRSFMTSIYAVLRFLQSEPGSAQEAELEMPDWGLEMRHKVRTLLFRCVTQFLCDKLFWREGPGVQLPPLPRKFHPTPVYLLLGPPQKYRDLVVPTDEGDPLAVPITGHDLYSLKSPADGLMHDLLNQYDFRATVSGPPPTQHQGEHSVVSAYAADLSEITAADVLAVNHRGSEASGASNGLGSDSSLVAEAECMPPTAFSVEDVFHHRDVFHTPAVRTFIARRIPSLPPASSWGDPVLGFATVLAAVRQEISLDRVVIVPFTTRYEDRHRRLLNVNGISIEARETSKWTAPSSFGDVVRRLVDAATLEAARLDREGPLDDPPAEFLAQLADALGFAAETLPCRAVDRGGAPPPSASKPSSMQRKKSHAQVHAPKAYKVSPAHRESLATGTTSSSPRPPAPLASAAAAAPAMTSGPPPPAKTRRQQHQQDTAISDTTRPTVQRLVYDDDNGPAEEKEECSRPPRSTAEPFDEASTDPTTMQGTKAARSGTASAAAAPRRREAAGGKRPFRGSTSSIDEPNALAVADLLVLSKMLIRRLDRAALPVLSDDPHAELPAIRLSQDDRAELCAALPLPLLNMFLGTASAYADGFESQLAFLAAAPSDERAMVLWEAVATLVLWASCVLHHCEPNPEAPSPLSLSSPRSAVRRTTSVRGMSLLGSMRHPPVTPPPSLQPLQSRRTDTSPRRRASTPRRTATTATATSPSKSPKKRNQQQEHQPATMAADVSMGEEAPALDIARRVLHMASKRWMPIAGMVLEEHVATPLARAATAGHGSLTAMVGDTTAHVPPAAAQHVQAIPQHVLCTLACLVLSWPPDATPAAPGLRRTGADLDRLCTMHWNALSFALHHRTAAGLHAIERTRDCIGCWTEALEGELAEGAGHEPAAACVTPSEQMCAGVTPTSRISQSAVGTPQTQAHLSRTPTPLAARAAKGAPATFESTGLHHMVVARDAALRCFASMLRPTRLCETTVGLHVVQWTLMFGFNRQASLSFVS